MEKGLQTRQRIIHGALALAAKEGLESISIARVAEKAGLSKSGAFAHFGSLEQLQMAVVDQAARQFAEDVFLPALSFEKGLPRLREIFRRWIDVQFKHKNQAACFFVAASFEYDDRSGAVKNHIKNYQLSWRQELVKAIDHCRELNHFKKEMSADLMAFELFSLVLAVHHDHQLFADKKAAEQALKIFEKILILYKGEKP